MEINPDELLLNAIRDGIREGVKSKITGYNSPLEKMIGKAIEDHHSAIYGMLTDAIRSCVEDVEFREEIVAATRKSLAKTLVARFGGELEKQVNALKSDPMTRARIVAAIDDIVQSSKQ